MAVLEFHTAVNFRVLWGYHNSIFWILYEKNKILLQV